MNQEQRAFLVDLGIELVYDYGFQRTEDENKVFLQKKREIETDFWGFGNNYAIALKHIKENLPDVQRIVDIGCCWGVFSHMFKDYQYVGLEEEPTIWKNDSFFKYYDHHQYVKGCFPFMNPGGDVFIASMSLGYGGEFYHNRDKKEVRQLFLEEISKFKYGYMKASEWVEELLEERFEGVSLDSDTGMIFWKHKNNM
jgi:hypothetical protein